MSVTVFDPEIEAVLRVRAKAALRKRLRGLRAAVPATGRAERSEKIVKRLAALPEWSAARAVALFWPMLERNEVDLRPLDELARAAGKIVGYPTLRDGADVPEPTFRIARPDQLEERGAIYLEPPPDAPELTADTATLVVVPAVGVTPNGDRIGYGLGFYDRLLARVAPPATSVAVAFEFQVLGELPTTAHDVRVDVVVTDERTFDARVA